MFQGKGVHIFLYCTTLTHIFIRVQPDDIGSHVNVGRTLKLLGDAVGAEKALTTALNLLPPIKKGRVCYVTCNICCTTIQGEDNSSHLLIFVCVCIDGCLRGWLGGLYKVCISNAYFVLL